MVQFGEHIFKWLVQPPTSFFFEQTNMGDSAEKSCKAQLINDNFSPEEVVPSELDEKTLYENLLAAKKSKD